MYFPKILILMFAAGAFGNKAPVLPQLTEVMDAVAPAASDAPVFHGTDAPVLRGRGTDAAMVTAALSEAAVETARASAGLRGATVDQNENVSAVL